MELGLPTLTAHELAGWVAGPTPVAAVAAAQVDEPNGVRVRVDDAELHAASSGVSPSSMSSWAAAHGITAAGGSVRGNVS